MNQKLKLLAACSVAALTGTACAPNGGTYAPHAQQTPGYTGSTGSTTASVTHSHSGKVHSHALPASGIRHTHTMGNNNTQTSPPQTTTRPPAPPSGNYNGGTAHSHSGRTHSHKLPASGLNHTHRVGGGQTQQQPQQAPPASNYTPPAANTNNQGGQAHSHNGKVHSHPLPASGLNHGHNMGGSRPPPPPPATGNNYRPPVNNTPVNNANGAVTHTHNGRTHSHRLPASGTNHAHRGGGGNQAPQQPRPQPPQNNNSGSSYYDTYNPPANTNTNTANTGGTAPNTGNSSYYDYSGQGSNSTYYDQARPKGGTNYGYQPQPQTQPKPPADTGSFPPQNYSGDTNAYVVRRGDTVFQVMRNTGVYWKDIIRLNNLQAPNYQINPGQRLRLR